MCHYGPKSRNKSKLEVFSPAEVDDKVALGGEPHVAVLAPEGLRVMPPVRRQLGWRHEHLVAILALVGDLHVNDRLSKV